MSELKPCPFCGNELPVHYIAMQNRYVQLISCPFCNGTVSCNKFLSDKDALTTWNTRPLEDVLLARIAECESALISMVQQFFYSKAGENIFRHAFMSAEEEAADYLVEHGIARWVGKNKSAIFFNEVQE